MEIEFINTKFKNPKSANLSGAQLSSDAYKGKSPALPKIRGKIKVKLSSDSNT